MGLDIYLYRYDAPVKQVKKENAAWEKITDAIWKAHTKASKKAGNKELTDAERDVWLAEVKKAADENGRVGEYHDHPCEVKIEKDSTIDPQHYFKLGYFRSSYNGNGINNILKDRIGEDLYSILGTEHNEYEVQPDWDAVIENCDSAIERLRAFGKENPFSIMEVDANMFTPIDQLPGDKNAVLALAKAALKQEIDPFFEGGFSNKDGFWNPKGTTVYGIVPGFKSFMNQKLPTSYVVVRHDKEGDEPFKWYVDALRIVKETAEYVLKQKNPEKFYLHVSG